MNSQDNTTEQTAEPVTTVIQSEVKTVHWTAIAGFWIGAVSAVSAIVFGAISLTAKCPETGRPLFRGGKGKGQMMHAIMGSEAPARGIK